MVIAIDIDAVLGDFLSQFLKYRNDTYGSSWKRDQFYTYVWSQVFKESKEQMYSIMSDFFNSDYIHEIKLMPGAKEGIDTLKTRGYTLDVVTSRPRLIKRETLKWLDQHFPGEFTRVYFSNQPAYGSFGPTKAMICEEIGAKFFIDDQYHYCEEVAKKGLQVFLFDNPWNQDIDLAPGIERIKTWNEIVSKIK
jgi:5'(3')-deoxyribonucleotidase